ncbi:WD repeat protein [Taphrina deformans PYCC 5710]|uniref:WD repeat protein n=1 Tax=Taphrina deformans (strain PYCC 5710 / ATCC 11124 / CBS 356.35 / IMI 108563 / JCM 9778 / NBRC 8474) TaxID=1097556 RepID=R4XCR3_TAPDE|nr:WD repeat protein [Taphrina deformans PYCC 5710]|eukprot:CCG83413.1 WD repeat protein [Taphrina deformans PYCC 5710]
MDTEMSEPDIAPPNDDERPLKRVKIEDDDSQDRAAALQEKSNVPAQHSARTFRPYKLRTTVTGHTRGISAVKFSHDGNYIATCSADCTVKIWLRDGTLHQTLSGHSKGVSDVSWSSDSALLVTASDDRTIRVWEAMSGRTVRLLKGHTNFVLCCAFNRPGNLIASGSFDESIRVWDVRAGTCLKTLPAHSDPAASVSFNIDGTMLVSCSHDGLIRIWDTASGQCLKTLVDQDSPPVSFAAFSPNGRYLLSCTLDSTIRLWNFVSSTPLKTYKGHRNTKYTLNAEFCNSEVIIGGEDGNVTIWDAQTKRIEQVLKTGEDVAIAVSRHAGTDDTRILAVASLDNKLRIYADH